MYHNGARGWPVTAARAMVRDALDRRKDFEAAHPEVTITPPGTLSAWWLARIPAAAGDPERTLSGWQLADLMDRLDQIWSPDG